MPSDFVDEPSETNPNELLSRIKELEKNLEIQKQRSTELEAGIVRMATYQGVLHVLKGA